MRKPGQTERERGKAEWKSRAAFKCSITDTNERTNTHENALTTHTHTHTFLQASRLAVFCVGGPFVSVLNKLPHKDRGLSQREEHQP